MLVPGVTADVGDKLEPSEEEDDMAVPIEPRPGGVKA